MGLGTDKIAWSIMNNQVIKREFRSRSTNILTITISYLESSYFIMLSYFVIRMNYYQYRFFLAEASQWKDKWFPFCTYTSISPLIHLKFRFRNREKSLILLPGLRVFLITSETYILTFKFPLILYTMKKGSMIILR